MPCRTIRETRYDDEKENVDGRFMHIGPVCLRAAGRGGAYYYWDNRRSNRRSRLGRLPGGRRPGGRHNNGHIYLRHVHTGFAGGGREGRYLYHSPPFGISLKIGQLEFKTDPENVSFVISIKDNVFPAGLGPPTDTMYIYSVNNLLSPIETPIGYQIWLSLHGNGSAISGDALPAGAPVLSDWGGRELLEIHSPYNPNQAQQFYVKGYVTDAFVIPEPATLGLLGLGALALLRKRSSTQITR